MCRADGQRVEKVQREVAVGDGVDRVRGHAVEPQLGGDHAAVGVEVDSGQGACAERQLRRRLEHGLESTDVTRDHPEVGQQMVRQVHRLRALQMRVSGQRPVEMRLGDVDQHAAQGVQSLDHPFGRCPREHGEVGDHLVVARPRGMELAARRPDDLRHAALHRHVDVLVVAAERERPVAELGLDRVQPGEDRVAVVVADDAPGGQHACVGARLGDVERPEPLVESQRRVHGLEGWVLREREARHGCRRVPGARGASRADGS